MLSHRSNTWAWSLLVIIASVLVGCGQAVQPTSPTIATPPAPTMPLVADTATSPGRSLTGVAAIRSTVVILDMTKIPDTGQMSVQQL